MSEIESNERQKLALEAIKNALGTEIGEDVDLFVEHHIEELSSEYWQQYLGRETPEPSAVLSLLQLRSSWGDGDIENYDYTLPGGVTNYVICVHFNESGRIDDLSMES